MIPVFDRATCQERLTAYGTTHGYDDTSHYQPFLAIFHLTQPIAGYDPPHLDGLLQWAVVQQALEGQPLPRSSMPYQIPLPLEVVWRSEDGLPLYHATDLWPQGSTRAGVQWWVKQNDHGTIMHLTERKASGSPWFPDDGSGVYKSYRMPLPTKEASTWTALGVGNLAEVRQLLALLLTGIGKKTNAGLGAVASIEVVPLAESEARSRFLEPQGNHYRLLRPVPLAACATLDLQALSAVPQQIGYTPPYWLPANQALCLASGQEVQVTKEEPISMPAAAPRSIPDFLVTCEMRDAIIRVDNFRVLHPKYQPGKGVGAVCAFSGLPIQENGAVAAKDAISNNMGNAVDFLKAPESPWVSNSAALILNRPKEWHRGFVALLCGEEAALLWPTFAVDLQEPQQPRPIWREALLDLAEKYVGWQIVAVCKDEVHARTWPRARIGTVGPQTPIHFSESKLGIASLFLVDVQEMKRLLLLIESLLDQGYGKNGILRGLRVQPPHTLSETLHLERELATLRGTAAFPLAWRAARTHDEREARRTGLWPKGSKKGQPDE